MDNNRERTRLVLDDGTLSVRVEGAVARLTPTQFRIVATIASADGRGVAKRTLAELLGCADGDDGRAGNLVVCHVRDARKRLEAAGIHGAICTVNGFGYRLDSDLYMPVGPFPDVVAEIALLRSMPAVTRWAANACKAVAACAAASDDEVVREAARLLLSDPVAAYAMNGGDI